MRLGDVPRPAGPHTDHFPHRNVAAAHHQIRAKGHGAGRDFCGIFKIPYPFEETKWPIFLCQRILPSIARAVTQRASLNSDGKKTRSPSQAGVAEAWELLSCFLRKPPLAISVCQSNAPVLRW